MKSTIYTKGENEYLLTKVEDKYQLIYDFNTILGTDFFRRLNLESSFANNDFDNIESTIKTNLPVFNYLINYLVDNKINNFFYKELFDNKFLFLYNDERDSFFKLDIPRNFHSLSKNDVRGSLSIVGEQPNKEIFSSYNFTKKEAFVDIILNDKKIQHIIRDGSTPVLSTPSNWHVSNKLNIKYDPKKKDVKFEFGDKTPDSFRESIKYILDTSNFERFFFSGLKADRASLDIISLMFDGNNIISEFIKNKDLYNHSKIKNN